MFVHKCVLVITIFMSCSYVSLLPVPDINDDAKIRCFVLHITDLLKNNCTYVGYSPDTRDENKTKGEM